MREVAFVRKTRDLLLATTHLPQSWSEMDLFHLRNSLAYGRSIEEVAGFLGRAQSRK
jgi:hypothetical protein